MPDVRLGHNTACLTGLLGIQMLFTEQFLLDWLVSMVWRVILLTSDPASLFSVWPGFLCWKPIFLTVLAVLVKDRLYKPIFLPFSGYRHFFHFFFISGQFLRLLWPLIPLYWDYKYRHIIYGWTQNLSGNTLKVVRSQSGHLVGRYSSKTGHW